MADNRHDDLKKLMKRAKDLKVEQEKSLLRRRLEGELLKFTNQFKRYQYRWCVVDPDSGTIEYYEKEEHKKSSKPRGILNLTYASVCPSEDDSQVFVIHSANGDFLRLKAANAKERQFWVTRIRAVAEYHSELAEHSPAVLPADEDRGSVANCTLPSHSEVRSLQPGNLPRTDPSHIPALGPKKRTPSGSVHGFTPPDSQQIVCAVEQQQEQLAPPSPEVMTLDLDGFPIFCPGGSGDPRAQLHELLRRLELETQALADTVDSASIRTPELTTVYKTLLLSKATSQAVLSCLKRCTDIIKGRSDNSVRPLLTVNNTDETSAVNTRCEVGATTVPLSVGEKSSSGGDESSISSHDSPGLPLSMGVFPSPILNMNLESVSLPEFPSDTQPDVPLPESELGSVENQKHILLHLLSQLSLGKELTKIVLPTFILEKRSLLEMFADYLAHADLFIGITLGSDPESRMLALLQWYLCSLHVGRKDKIARKPYNPIIGECFHCCWLVNPDRANVPDDPSTPILMTYCAEQVSHHPPISAFHVDLPAHKMQLDSSVHTKSNFHGLSISVTMLGQTVLHLGEHNEDYHFSFPTAYANSILTVPWVEFKGKVSILCPQTGYRAIVVFHGKPMRSNKVHRITAEIFAPTTSEKSDSDNASDPVARVSGEWNGVLEFELLRPKVGRKWSIDVNTLPVTQKRVRPIDKQNPEESRFLWQHVTSALEAGNMQLATEKKAELEERQRFSEKYRARHHLSFPVKYFEWNGNAWVFRKPRNSSLS